MGGVVRGVSLRGALAAVAILASSGAGGAEPHDIRTGGAYWDVQLTDPFDLSVDVNVFELDADSVSKADIAALKARGVKTVCYVSVGTVEEYRDDAGAFPADVIGPAMEEWPDERFLDIRRRDVLVPLMFKRFEKCQALGFDAIQPDNMDIYESDTGFSLSLADQVMYMQALIDAAHGLGLQIAQKNAPELIPFLKDRFDFLVLEECVAYGFCEEAKPYLDAGKDVLAIEYETTPSQEQAICAEGERLGIRFIFKDWDLVAGGRGC